MTRVEQIGEAKLWQGDALAVLRELPECSVDTVITDPPYELGFMGKSWDAAGVSFRPETWAAVLRVAKPGAIMLCFGGTRTWHRIACAIEDAGWLIKDTCMWVYGSGFPKSLDLSKAIDKASGIEREDLGPKPGAVGRTTNKTGGAYGADHPDDREAKDRITAPATDAAKLWNGYGTALKPAWEPIIVAMKPLDGTFAENAQKWGVAGLNIDGGRVGAENTQRKDCAQMFSKGGVRDDNGRDALNRSSTGSEAGRWPANVLHDGSEEVLAGFPQTASIGHHPRSRGIGGISTDGHAGQDDLDERHGDTGSAARFFYCAKASRSERDAGCEGLAGRTGAQAVDRKENTAGLKSPRAGAGRSAENVKNFHPTVKPVALMRYLARLTKTPTGGVVLDPFAGSGTTLLACLTEGRSCIGIEKHPDYFDIACRRIDREVRQGNLFKLPPTKPTQETLL